MTVRSFITAAILGIASIAPAHAALLEGKIIGAQYRYPNLATAQTWYGSGQYLVRAGKEVDAMAVGSYSNISHDYSDTRIQLSFERWTSPTLWDDPVFNGFHFYDANGTIDAFTSVRLGSNTNMVGLTQDRITFDANNIWLNWSGLSFNGSTIVSLDLQAVSNDVPEPGSLALFGLAAGALALARRRFKA